MEDQTLGQQAEPPSGDTLRIERRLEDDALREAGEHPRRKVWRKLIQAVCVTFIGLLGILAGSLVPQVYQRVRAVVGSPPLPAFADTREPSAGPKDNVKRQDSGSARAQIEPERDSAGLLKLTDEQISGQEIEIALVRGGTLSRHIVVPGTITPDVDRIVRVPARVVGTVAEMRKRLGDSVKKGEVVAVLDSREVADAKSEYLTASVNFDLQKTLFERTQELRNKGITAEQQFLQVRATYTEAKLRFDLARQKLSALGIDAAEVADAAKREENTAARSSLRQYELTSPLAGRIVERKVDVGTAVGKEGDPADLYTVADLSTVWVELSVPTSELSRIKEGQAVSIGTESHDRQAQGKLVFVSPLLNPETRSARVIAAVANPQLAWRPGTFVMAEIEIAQDPVKVMVPRSALQTIGGERVVFVRTLEGFQRRDVKVGRSDDEGFEILSGLAEGDEIATKNTFLLKAELGKTEAKHDD